MSTKLYEAYRFPRGRLDEFLLLFNHLCLKAIRKHVTGTRLSETVLSEFSKALFGKNPKAAEKYSLSDLNLIWILAEAMRISKLGENDIFNLDSSCNLWLRGRWCYMVPYVANCMRGMGKSLPKWCEFYGYWDNTDPQEGVPKQEWDARERIWKEIALEDWDRIRLSHIVLEMRMPNLNGLDTLLKSINPEDEWRGKILMAASSVYWKTQAKIDTERAKRAAKRV